MATPKSGIRKDTLGQFSYHNSILQSIPELPSPAKNDYSPEKQLKPPFPQTILKPKIANSEISPINGKPPTTFQMQNKVQKVFNFKFIKVLVSEKVSKN